MGQTSPDSQGHRNFVRMGYEYFLAKRYAFSKKRENFITIISVLSMLGVLVGTAALITVLSVFNGFSSLVTDLLLVFDPHVRITAKAIPVDVDSTPSTSQATIARYAELETQLRSRAEVRTVGPVVQGKCVLVHFTLPRVAMLIGMAEGDAAAINGLKNAVVGGAFSLSDGHLMLGQQLADQLAVIVGDTIEVISPVGLEKILTEPVAPRMRRLIVTGIFAANNKDYDAINAYCNIATARDLFDIPRDAATSMDVRLHNIDRSIDLKDELAAELDTGKYVVQSWYDLHTDLYSVMEMERWVAYIILFLIVAVACFNIFSSLTLTVFEKQKDIALLRALGTSEGGIRTIYLLQGTLVGLVGTIAGCLLGFVIVYLQQEYGFYRLQSAVYIVPALPVELRLSDFFFVGLGSIGLATVGALIPARRAARIKPAQALRYE